MAGDHLLGNERILIVEDEYMIVEELCMEFAEIGATVVGPAGTVEEALRIVRSKAMIDGVILDINLRGRMSFMVADLLLDRGIPFIFATGYDASSIPRRFNHIPRCEKPVSVQEMVEAIGLAVRS